MFVSKTIIMNNITTCHSEHSEAKSRNLRFMITFADKSVPRSFDSLCSLRMTTTFIVFSLYMLIKAGNHK